MPDQTPVTDDDLRNLREDAETVRNSPGSQRTAVRLAEYVLDTVPAPPATLADEIREEGAGRPPGAVKRVNALADRVEAEVERLTRDLESQALLNKLKQGQVNAARAERDEFQNEMISSERKQAKLEAEVQRLTTELARKEASRQHYVRHAQASSDERDEARAEVERLTVSLNRQCTTVTPSVHYSDALPDPADVSRGEPWTVVYNHRTVIGVRTGGYPTCPWRIIYEDNSYLVPVSDEEITLVSRLVSDTRRVIDRPEMLDAMAAGSVILDHDADSWTRHDDALWYCFRGTSADCEALIDAYGPVTVVHEPMIDSGDSGDGRTPDCPTQG